MSFASPIVRISLVMAALAALLVGSFLGSFVVQRAAAVNGDGTIYACKGERSGALRVVDGPGECLRGEEPISWSAVSGVTGWELIQDTTAQVAGPNSAAFWALACSGPEKQVLSGGVTSGIGNSKHYTVEMLPFAATDRMQIAVYNHDPVDPASVFGWIICADAS